MTQKNIEIMDTIVDAMIEGEKISQALKRVYSKRNVVVRCSTKILETPITELHLSARAENSLIRGKVKTINDVTVYTEKNSIMNIKNLGKSSALELFEAILDYCWDYMDNDERTTFLIDVVQRNEEYILTN